MTDPWNLRQDDTRLADSLPTFIIFCEDEVSEPIYFKYFETSVIKVNTVDGQKSKIHNVIKAITHCIDEKLMEQNNGEPVLKSTDTQVWCVFDRDTEEDAGKVKLGDTEFNVAIETAAKRGIKVAWSNDSFELWILLHFEDVTPEKTENKSRITYYERLTILFKSLTTGNPDLTKALASAGFNYKRDLKHRTNFRNIVRAEIVTKTNQAIARAKVLEQHHQNSPKLHSEKKPCTTVHHLVEELLKLGGKAF